MMLSPPSAKKLSSIPTRESPSTSANSPHRISSAGVRGPRPARPASGSGAGSARTVELAVRRQRKTSPQTQTPTEPCTPAAAAARCARNAPASTPARTRRRRHIARPAAPARRSSRTTQPPPAAPRHDPAAAASISPGSMRKPAQLHLRIRPARQTPAPRPRRHRAKSPVRYIRLPAAPNGSATNRSPVKSARPTYPRANPAPAM